MIKKILIVSGIVLLVGSAFLYFNSEPRTASQTNDTPKVVQSTTPEPKPAVPTVKELHRLTNNEREKRGIKPLKLNESLNKSAQAKADDMVENDYYGHKNPKTGKQGYSYVTDVLGYGYCRRYGENIAGAFDSSHSVEKWMDSKPHKKAILDSDYDAIGFGITKHKHEYYFVQHFCDIM